MVHDRLDRRYGLKIAITAALGALFFHPAMAVDQRAPSRMPVDAEFHASLRELAQQCEDEGLHDERQMTLDWIVRRDPLRQYFFLATDAIAGDRTYELSSKARDWSQQFLQLRRQYAQGLYQLVGALLEAGDAVAAYRTLFEVLRENPDHAAARRILGYKLVEERWQTAFARRMLESGRVNHPRFGWLSADHVRRYEAGHRYFRSRWISVDQEDRFRGRMSQGWRIETEHYLVRTNHSLEAGVALGRQLETLYDVWRQLFVAYYASDEILARRIRGESVELAPRRKYKVAFYRNRNEYIRDLKKYQPRIDMTLGIYLGRQRTAFFHANDEEGQATLFHEATHQLFHENGPGRQRSGDDVGLDYNFWIVEGVAIYFESLQQHDGYATLGGLDAPRLQYARHNVFSGGFYEPLQRLTAMGREAVQNHEQIRLLYSQAAGLTQLLMHHHHGVHRAALVEYIKSVYRRRDRPETLAELAGTSFSELDDAYRAFLEVRDEDLMEQPYLESTRRLLLGRTQITDTGTASLVRATQLEDLNVDGTAITDASLAVFGQLAQLRELDVSGTRISDVGLRHLRDLHQLRVLWLSGTALTDQCLPYLSALQNLEQLHLENTQISTDGLQSLRHLLPSVKIER